MEATMKKFATNFVMALALSATMSVMIFAGEKKDTVNLSRDTTVNGTVVKKGQYKVTVDEQSGELTIWQGKNAVAKATAHAENRTDKASRTSLCQRCVTTSAIKINRSLTVKFNSVRVDS
jgi:hypothetical protein